MDDRPAAPEDFYAGWLKARLNLLWGTVERVFAPFTACRLEDEAWRTGVIGETFPRRTVQEAGAPVVLPRFATVHRRSGRMLDLLVAAGDALREAGARRDTALFARAIGQMDDAEEATRSAFAAAYLAMED